MHDAHGQSLLRYVLRLTRGDMPFAEDVVQESLLRLWRRPEVLAQPSESVRAWLFTVARNQVIDDRRSARFGRELRTD
ncbi:sigma factor, partial [Mycolicibacterium elephantis]